MRINLFAPINYLGTGIHAWNMGKALESLGHEICLIPPFGRVGFQTEQVQAWLLRRQSFSAKDASLMIFDPAWMSQFSGQPRIGFAVFETSAIPALELAMIKSLDIALTPSLWGQAVLKHHGVEAKVVPEGFDPEIFKPQRSVSDTSKPFTFVNVGKLEARKGTLTLIRAFAEALTGERANLALKCDNPFDQEWYGDIVRTSVRAGFEPEPGTNSPTFFRNKDLKIVLLPAEAGFHEMASVYADADCGVFPTAGEGWGLPILECLASGTPVICGLWTAMADYVLDRRPLSQFLLRRSDYVIAKGQFFEGLKGSWHQPDFQELVEKIRFAHRFGREIKAGQEFSEVVSWVREKFTWENAAIAFLSAIK